MIRTFGSISWMRFPTVVYMAARSVLGLLPQVGVSTRQPTVDGLGSFTMSMAATSGFCRYRAAMPCQAAKNVLAGQRWLYHRPLPSRSEQHQPGSRMWQFGMTMRPSPVSAAPQASETCIGGAPDRSALAARD